MAAQVTNYQCPSCTGPLHFDGETGKLACDYCGSSFDVSEMEALYASKEAEAEEAYAQQEEEDRLDIEGEWENSGSETWGEEDGMKAYSCPSCGAELICDETTAATSCPYCGNPSIVPGKFTGALKPDYVLPFKLDKEDAINALKNYYRGKKLLPKNFSNANHIQEIKGVYVPFWLYDGSVSGDVRYSASRVHSRVQGDERITITEHFMLRRAGTADFRRIPVDASSKMPDAHMDAIEPFDYSELKSFSTAYMPGFLADKYDVSMEDCSKRADERATNTLNQMLDSTAIGYATCIPLNRRVSLKRGQVKYALLPVWLLSTRWNGKNFLFAMNGQTGKLIGDLPVSWGRFFAWFAGISLPLMAVMAVLMLL